MSRLEPRASEASLAYWDATRDKRLVLQWCLDCEQFVHFPRVVCPRCLGSRFDHREVAGTAVVHAVVVEHRPPSPFEDDQPYAVALVDLDEGVRMVTNVIGCPVMEVRPGLRVRLTWEPLSDGRHLPLFEPFSPPAG